MNTAAAAPAFSWSRSSPERSGFIAAFLGWFLDGFETYAVVLVGHQVAADFYGPNADPIYFGGILGATLAAWAVGGLLSGIICDYFGRKRTLMLSIVWYAVFTGLTALSPNYAIFIVFRLLTGIGMGAEWGPGSALVSEIWSNKSRGKGIALLQGGFGVGFLAATGVWAFVNTGPDSWRYMFLIGIAPALLAVYVRRFVVDPDIWVAADERRRVARERKKAGHQLSEDEQALSLLTIKALFRDTGMRNQILKLLVLAGSTLIGWWAVSTWIPAYTAGLAVAHKLDPAVMITFIALCYNAGGVVGYFMFGVLADKIGRKRTMFLYYVGALAMVPILFLVHGSPETTLPLLAGINGVFTLGMFTWMAVYPVELFPTYARGTAITVIFNATRFIAAAFAIISGYLVTLFGGITTAAVVIGSIYVLGVIFALWAGPETKGKPLPA